MSLPRPAVMQRGASVLAALVIAAALASIALVVQQGSPVAYTQSQTAEAGATAASAKDSATLQSTCDPSYDYEVSIKDGKEAIMPVPVCDTPGQSISAAAAAPFGQKVACHKDDKTGKIVPNFERQSNVKACPAAGTSGKSPDCKITTCDSSTPLKQGVAKAKAESISSAYLAGQISASDLQKLKSSLDAPSQQVLSDAFSSKENALDDANMALQDQKKAVQDKLAECAKNSCDEGTLNQLDQKAAALDKAQASLDDQYAKLADAAKALDASDGPPKGQCTSDTDPNCKNLSSPTVAQRCQSDPSLPECTINRNTGGCQGANCNTSFRSDGPGGNSAACQACQSGNQNSCMQCAKDQGNTGGMPGAGQGGQKSSGGASGSGQQQQCQPQYQCSNNTVMYSQCPQQNSQWQSVQQCPTGYTCSGNSCQAQAPYGYCTNGQPRTAPAQAQPAASSCSAGTWQDSSSGCQQSWQCSTGSTTGAPTAQLSCQPLTAASGMTITLAYVCSGGSTKVAATGFTATETELASTTKTIIQKPTDGTNSVTYAVTCTNANASPVTTASAQCSVSVGNAAIVLVATPEKIAKTETEDLKRKSTIGWVTSGMQSCVISNTDFADWTTAQAGNTSISGAAVSPIITADTTFKLTCQTLGGATASSTVKVLSI